MRRALAVLTLFCLSCLATAYTRPPGTTDPAKALALYNQGCDLYENKQFDRAKEKFLEAASLGWQHPHLFYNLGNCYFRLKDFGRAILFYEKALTLAPRDAAIAYNLGLAREMIVDKVQPKKRNIIAELFLGIYSLLNINEWTVASLGIYLLLMLTVILGLLVKARAYTRVLKRIAVIALVVLVFCAVNAGAKIYASKCHAFAIVVLEEAKARSGPGADFAEVFVVHSGTKVRIMGEHQDWAQVSLEGGLSGWLPKSAVERV